jgi:hypothetical protein
MKTKLLLSAMVVASCLFGSATPADCQNWVTTSAPSNYWWSVASSADGVRLAAVETGTVVVETGVVSPPAASSVYISTNSGATWFPVLTITNLRWGTVAMTADGAKIFAAGFGFFNVTNVTGAGIGAPIYSSADFGMTWAQTSAPSNIWSAIATSADGTKLAAAAGSFGAVGAIYTSTNSGATWAQTSARVTNWFSIASSADGNKLAAAVIGGVTPVGPGQFRTNTGLIYTSTNAGATWTPASVPSTFWTSVASSADGTVLAATAESGPAVPGPIYTSTNSGRTWKSTSAPMANWNSIASSADGRKLAAAVYAGPIYTSVDSGVTWVSNNAPTSYWNSIASSADGNALVTVAWNGGIIASHSTPQPGSGIAPAGGNIAVSWIVPSTNFVLQTSAGSGTGWTDVATAPVMNLTNLMYEVVVPTTNPAAFYRLEIR